MKKTLIVAAIAATLAAPAIATADTKIYGNFRASLNTGDLNGVDNSATVVNNASRLGLKGAIGNDNLKGIYHLQMGANNDGAGSALSSRFYFAGLKGGFGKVIYGRLSTPYKMAGVKQDPFYDTSAGTANGGSNHGYSSLNNSFTNNTIAYYSPKIGGGVSFNASVSIDDAASDDHDYGIGVEYATKAFKVGVSHLELGDTPVIAANGGAETATRIYASAKVGAAGTVAASLESVDFGGADNAKFTHVNGTYKVSPKVKLAASVSNVSDGLAGAGRNSDSDGAAVGVFYNVLENTTLSAMYTSVDYSDDTAVDRDGIAFGVVQKF